MKKFLFRTSLFLLPLLLGAIGMDFYLKNLNTLYKEKISGLIISQDSIEVLILGNSHACYGVDPNQFNLNAYNIANVNQSVYFDKRITLKYLPQLKKLKYVLISVDFHSLYFSSQGVRNKWSYYSNGIKYKDEKYFKSDLSPFLFGFGPKYSSLLLLKNLKLKWKFRNTERAIDFDIETGVNPLDTITKGFLPYAELNEHEWNLDHFKKRANNFSNGNKKPFLDVLGDLVGFIQELKKNNITPIIISTPCFSEYNDLLDKGKVEEYLKLIKYISQTHDIPIWESAFNNNFLKEDFFNCDHLNKTGAIKYSKSLNQKLNKLIDSKQK